MCDIVKTYKTMAEEAKVDAQVAESKATETEKTVEKSKEDTQKTVGEMAEGVTPKEDPRVVDEHIFVAEKKARKAAEKELKELRKTIEDGATKAEINDSVDAIADEHNIDKGFLKKLVSTIKAETEKDLDAKYLTKIEQKERVEKFDSVFSKAFDKAIERTPDFKNIANPEIIKVLATQPSNSKKTISELLEETYGNAIVGKRTIETTSPNGGKEPEPINFAKAEKDIEYFKEIMADPKKKAEYNQRMLSKGF